jgi:uncharacterized surface protein with fasciclin (FAS1) repeats
MPPEESGRTRRITGLIALLAILGLILAVLIASCAGGADPAAETEPVATTAEAATTAANVQETTQTQTETEAEEPEPAEAEQTEPAETETTETAEETTETDADDASTEPDDAATGGEQEVEPEPVTLLDAAAEAGSFDTFLGLVEQSTLDETLRGDGSFTLFAPTDEAFDELPEELSAALENEPAALEQLLSYHVVPEAIAPDALVPGALETLEGAPLEISERAGRQYAADAPILPPALEADNGWLHPIGYVLLPPDLDLADLVGEEAAAEAYDRADFVVFFETGSAELDAAAQATIAEAATAIQALPAGSRVRLVGVADAQGDAAANLELSRERARAVQAALEQAVPDADVRYVVRARGEEEGGELANARRVDIVLNPPEA